MKVIILGLCLALVVADTALAAIVESDAAKQSVYGRVTDLFGSPLSGAVVELTPMQSSQKISVRTERDGSYLVRDLPAGEVTLAAKAQGFRTETETLSLQTDEQVLLDFGLEAGSIADQPPVKLSGMVQQTSKSPIKDATVTVINAFNRRLLRTVKSDSRGHFQVEFKNGGQYLVYATKPGFLVSTAAVVLPAAMPRKRQINLVLLPISGSVYGFSN